ncbi:class I SAM-dependent methyltransferase [bacterium]|nr:class I SAM-dependent methyltransferase [bacterium]
MQDDIIISVVQSLDGEDEALYPYLPYLLQDLWEIGSSADVILGLIRKHQLDQQSDFTVLDLGCGKGAISVPLARVFGFRVHGIDAMPAFIKEAWEHAEQNGVSHLCRFEVGDIRKLSSEFKGYDLIILGSIGPVLGTVEETLKQIKLRLRPNGHVVLDDGYIPDNVSWQSDMYLSETEMMKQIQRAGFICAGQQTMDASFIKKSNRQIYQAIEKRANEFILQYPDKQDILQKYLDAQIRENQILENQLVCVTYLLRRI